MIAKLIYIDSKMNSIIRKYLYIIIQNESNFVHSAMQVDRTVVLRLQLFGIAFRSSNFKISIIQLLVHA